MFISSIHPIGTYLQDSQIIEKAHHDTKDKDTRVNVTVEAMRSKGHEIGFIYNVLKKVESVSCIMENEVNDKGIEQGVIEGPEYTEFRDVRTLEGRLVAQLGCKVHPAEKFLNELTLGGGTAFFVGGRKNNLVFTARHCTDDMENKEKKVRFIFDFRSGKKPNENYIIDDENGILRIPTKNIYKFKKIVAKGMSSPDNPWDWAIVKVDREITGRKPLSINFDKIIKTSDTVYMLGHPKGMPMKFTKGVVSLETQQHFNANVDGFRGNSGSPLINDDKVVGIFIKGPTDYTIETDEKGQMTIRGNFYPTREDDETCQRMSTIHFAKWYFQKENPYNQSRLGMAYYEGKDGAKQDYAKAVKYFEQSSASKVLHSLFMLGCCYLFGQGKERDEKKAYQYFEKAIKAGNTAVLDVLKIWSRAGKSYALYHLGRCYQYGYGGEKDEAKAFDCYRQAAERENIESYNSLGFCYQNGLGVAKDDEKAIKNYLKAIEHGNEGPLVFLYLGHCYQRGVGCVKNNNTAFSFFKRSADAGNKEGAYQTALCYKNGEGVQRNTNAALEYFEKAGDDMIDKDIAHWMWFAFEEKEKQFKYLKMSCDKGDKSNLYILGTYYADGIGTPKNLRKAFDCFEEKARMYQNNYETAKALYFLGRYYESGIEGVEKNKKLALMYYKRSHDEGHPTAGIFYKELKEKGCTIM